MINTKRLQEKATLFRLILENTCRSTNDQAIKNIAVEIEPPLRKISQGEINTPINYPHRHHLHSLESPIFEKYPSLSYASASMIMVLEDIEVNYPSDAWKNPEILRGHARNFLAVLRKYASHDEAARQLESQIQNLMSDIEQLRVTPPVVNSYRRWFTDQDSPLFDKYPDLTEAASNFDAAIEEGWFIIGNGKLFGRDNTPDASAPSGSGPQ